MQASDFETACRLFAESQQKEPAPGTALNLGECEERRGRLVSARDAFATAAATFKTQDKQKYAASRLEAVDKRIPRLTLRARAVKGLALSVDGESVHADTEVPRDPGEVTIVAKAPGHKTKELRATLREGRSLEVDVGALETETPGTPAARRHETPRAAPETPAQPASSGLRTVGLVVGGAGVAALAVGAVTGIMTFDRASIVDAHCDDAMRCDREGLDAASSGRTLSLVSTIAVSAGAAALALGAVLFFTSPNKAAVVAPSAGRRGAGLTLRVSF